MLFKETVETGTLDMIKRLMRDDQLRDFYLVGGTALSLLIGHRISIDIDLFTNKDFDARKLGAHLEQNYSVEKLRTLKNGVFGLIEDVKVDLISHQYKWLRPVEHIEGVRIVSRHDIAAMKMHAIVQSGNRLKDFFDVYSLLEHMSLREMAVSYVSKYPEANESLVYSAVLYHNDIDFSMSIKFPREQVDWARISNRLNQAILYKDRKFSSEILQVKRKRGRGI